MKIGKNYFLFNKNNNKFYLHRIDVVTAFQILADAAKTNMDILETIQLLAQG